MKTSIAVIKNDNNNIKDNNHNNDNTSSCNISGRDKIRSSPNRSFIDTVDEYFDCSTKGSSYNNIIGMKRQQAGLCYDNTKQSYTKRIRTSNKKVHFANNETIITCHPYQIGMTDMEVLNTYSADIWYTHKDYSEFLKDRLDTISIYRSVGGDMSCLKGHYCVRGLEPFLEVNQHYYFQKRMQAFVQAVITEQRRQKQVNNGRIDHEALRIFISFRTAETLNQAIERATIDSIEAKATDDDDHHDDDGSDSEDDDTDSCVSTSDDAVSCHKPASAAPSFFPLQQPFTASKFAPMATTNQQAKQAPTPRPQFFVDVASLRSINQKFLDDIDTTDPDLIGGDGSKAAATATSKSSEEEKHSDFLASKIDLALNEVDQELEQWSSLLQVEQRPGGNTLQPLQQAQPQRRHHRQQQQQQHTTTTTTNYMPYHTTLNLSPLRRDSMGKSAGYGVERPSLYSLQQQRMALEAQTRAMLNNGNMSTVRRDSLSATTTNTTTGM